MIIVVTGATGSVGRHIVDQLLARGQQVRAVTRDPATARLPAGVQTWRADLTEPASMAPALTGTDGMYLFPNPATARPVAELARRAGVHRIVTLSSALADEDPDFHLAVERAVEAVGVEWTHLRPGMFAGNLLEWADSIRHQGVVRAPFAHAAQTPLHEADIAAVAVAALTEDGHAGARYTLSGPEVLTKIEQAQAIGTGLGREIRFEELTPGQWRAEQGPSLPDAVAEFLLARWAAASVDPEPALPTVQEVTGQPPRTLARWAADHAEGFGGARR